MPKRQEDELRARIVAASRETGAIGLNQGTSGNISARFGDEILITPSGVAYDTMSADDIVRMDLEGGYYGELMPSSEWRMHLDIFRQRPEAGAVVHVHPTFATAISCLRAGIPPFHYMIAVAGGTDIRCAEYATFGTGALSERMMAALEGRSACLLANHGMICFGADLGRAMWLAVEVETLARQYWHARQAGTPILLDDVEMATVQTRFKTYGRQPGEIEEGELEVIGAPVRRDLPPTRPPTRARKKDPRRPRSTTKRPPRRTR